MFMHRICRVCGTLALACALAAPAYAEMVGSLRVRLHPYAAAPGVLPAEAQALLESLAGTTLTLTGTTRTGALELALADPVEASAAAAMVGKLRVDRSVLWAEAITPPATTAKTAPADPNSSNAPGRRLMLRLKDGVTPVWPELTARISTIIGVPVTFERQIAQISVLSVLVPQGQEALAEMARAIQQLPEVQYADPVRRMHAFAAPNDPLYSQQWSLNGSLAGINAEAAWALQPSAATVTVAVVDTGIVPHPDLDGRVLPGYDFITDPDMARDGNARDSDPRDEGDWAPECGLPTSSWHGLFVAGQIAANTNNGIGVAGVAGNVNILPVRVLGRCGGTNEDIAAGIMWASGIAIAGVPANKTPARVINLSLGGNSPCDQTMQEAVDDALAQGAVIVAAAGNSFMNAGDFSPANCSGVIAVGAHSARGGLTSYSNYGPRVDLTAPGGDLPFADLIVGLSNNGATTPKDPDYTYYRGTSMAAPMVSGVAAMLFARDGLLTGGRVLAHLAGTARAWPTSSRCVLQFLCGAGMLDAGAAVASTLPGGSTTPPNTYRVVEYYRSDIDHYFITADPAEVHYIDTFLSGTFQRTGLYFYAYLDAALAPPGSRPVCRFYASEAVFINSHYYSANLDECLTVLLNWPDIWNLETASAFYIQVPDANGNCPSKTLPVYRFFDGRRDANHRYTVDLSVRRAMLNRAWLSEGSGANGVAFCSPI